MNRARRVIAVVGAVAAIALLVSSPGSAQNDDVASTLHNLSVSSGGTDPTAGNLVDYGEICVYCHTPHGGQIDAPLWNRAFPATAGYQMYTSATIDMDIEPDAPTGISLACLSCHDGTIGLDVITNPPNTFLGTVPGTTPGTNTMPSGGFTLLDQDLRNDHPVSVVYDPARDPAFNTVAAITGAGLKLFTDNQGSFPGQAKVQCASCHNPHDNTTGTPFLRIANTGSTLCTTCHIK